MVRGVQEGYWGEFTAVDLCRERRAAGVLQEVGEQVGEHVMRHYAHISANECLRVTRTLSAHTLSARTLSAHTLSAHTHTHTPHTRKSNTPFPLQVPRAVLGLPRACVRARDSARQENRQRAAKGQGAECGQDSRRPQRVLEKICY